MKGDLAAVVAMGDIARSPRMLNHARELAANGFAVVLIGYCGREFEAPAGIRVVGLDGGRSAPPGASGFRFLMQAGFRMGRLSIALFRVLVREKPRAILVQNPPSFPTLTAAMLAAKYVGATVTVDWHNYGFSLLGLRLGAGHWLVRLARWYEFHAGRRAPLNLCVSCAMREDLMRRAGIRAEVLYDRAVASAGDKIASGTDRLVAVCPAGWTGDEDMELLLDALEAVQNAAVTVYITGDGPTRKELAPRLAVLRLKGVVADTGFLAEAEYWDLIRRADLGLSLHRSSSGLDLAMKVVDLFSAGAPVCALDYGGSIREQIEDGVTGFLFRTARDLAALLMRLGADRSALEAMRDGVRERWQVSWSDEWKRVVLPEWSPRTRTSSPTRASAADRGVRPTVLIAHPYVYPSGGGNSVAAWALQALRDEFDVTLATLGPVDYEAVNRSFGTSLRREDFKTLMAPASWLGMMRSVPTPGALLEQCVTMRWAQDLDRENRFDALVSTQNEADFGRQGLHYVHFPWAYLPRPDNEVRWYHRLPGFLIAYRSFCRSVARASDEGLRRNLSLANSEFVAGRMRDVHRVESKILYPPVPGGFPSVPWERRTDGIVAVGRMHATKRWETAVEIADRVRSQGIDVSLTLISHRDDIEFGTRMEALAAARPWFRILYDLPRERMVEEVARHRYGLHTMQNEHFRIAPAELQRAGCITFVHRSGGPMEIVGRREELMFDDAAECGERICRVVRDAAVQGELRRFAAERAEWFSEERFCTELRGYVRALLP